MSKMYFAEDGNYGSAHGMAIIDTDNWSEAMLSLVDEVGDNWRPELALHFEQEDHKMEPDDLVFRCVVCQLTDEELQN